MNILYQLLQIADVTVGHSDQEIAGVSLCFSVAGFTLFLQDKLGKDHASVTDWNMN